jgi:calcium channel MID1
MTHPCFVYQYTNTTSDSTCQVIFDLNFCDSVAYAVPTNSSYKDKDNDLKDLYDNKAQDYYTNFTRSLAQIACDTAGESQYSLARTCKDCEHDYKNWLCSILIPRCEDWNSTKPFLQERNVNMPLPNGSLTFNGNMSATVNDTKRQRLGYNSTRNPGIDVVAVQAPYKEMLPCIDLCFDIVRSCPANLGFTCPNSPARELSYGQRDPNDVELRCNFPGAVVKLNVQGAAGSLSAHVRIAVLVALVAVGSLVL